MTEVRKQVADQLVRVQSTASALAQLDVLDSFAAAFPVLARLCAPAGQPWVDRILLRDSRHPVVEALNRTALPFVPNDAQLDKNENRVAIITGPNMAGKSTYMRQAATDRTDGADRLFCTGGIGGDRCWWQATLYPCGRVPRSGGRTVHLYGRDVWRWRKFSKHATRPQLVDFG